MEWCAQNMTNYTAKKKKTCASCGLTPCPTTDRSLNVTTLRIVLKRLADAKSKGISVADRISMFDKWRAKTGVGGARFISTHASPLLCMLH